MNSKATVLSDARLRAADLAGAVLDDSGRAAHIALKYYLEEVRAGRVIPTREQCRAIQSMLAQYEGHSKASRNPSVKPSTTFQLQVHRAGRQIEVTFVQPAGMSLGEMLRAVENATPFEPLRENLLRIDVVFPHGELPKDPGLDVKAKHDTIHILIIPRDSKLMVRSEQTKLLESRGLTWAPRAVCTVAAALFRDKQGFPPDRTQIGTNYDKGNLFEDFSVRTQEGGTGALYCSDSGLNDAWIPDNPAERVLAAGCPVPTPAP